ncbi:hypothetical protein [Sphingorhabdus sp. M41]|uniref:hypothetical protein n=1 Tax=Sphingorhabdus sp. M41 TaxID=1806885 RepID=UPI00078C3379|nr:hypothetical protein [Sphingorhabdus sp. M41]AMO72184.1 hypothetical protein AZE99_10265 [Sphingorhabdus sp. M41]
MASGSSLYYLSHHANGLADSFDVERKEGVFFFNTVKFVKFIRLLARNLNGGGAYFAGAAIKAVVPSICLRAF